MVSDSCFREVSGIRPATRNSSMWANKEPGGLGSRIYYDSHITAFICTASACCCCKCHCYSGCCLCSCSWFCCWCRWQRRYVRNFGSTLDVQISFRQQCIQCLSTASATRIRAENSSLFKPGGSLNGPNSTLCCLSCPGLKKTIIHGMPSPLSLTAFLFSYFCFIASLCPIPAPNDPMPGTGTRCRATVLATAFATRQRSQRYRNAWCAPSPNTTSLGFWFFTDRMMILTGHVSLQLSVMAYQLSVRCFLSKSIIFAERRINATLSGGHLCSPWFRAMLVPSSWPGKPRLGPAHWQTKLWASVFGQTWQIAMPSSHSNTATLYNRQFSNVAIQSLIIWCSIRFWMLMDNWRNVELGGRGGEGRRGHRGGGEKAKHSFCFFGGGSRLDIVLNRGQELRCSNVVVLRLEFLIVPRA